MRFGERFLVHQWTDGCAVFDRQTGDTHALDSLACTAFATAQDGASLRESVQQLAPSFYPDKAADELALLVCECCERLEKCGLMESEKSN